MPTTAELFDLARVPVPLRGLLDVPSPWQVLGLLDAFASEMPTARLGNVHPTAIVEGPLYLGEGASVGPYAYLEGPVYLSPGGAGRAPR